MSYDPLTGSGWDRHEAVMAWNKSMDRVKHERNGLRWTLRGGPGAWVWTFFDFGPWTGQLRIREDGFHWLTLTYGGTEPIHEGVTTSLYEAFQSVERNEVVRRASWVRVEPGACTCHYPPMEHDRWEIKNPHGDGRNYLVTDAVIRTYGRRHVEGRLLAKLPPLPERAWEADTHA